MPPAFDSPLTPSMPGGSQPRAIGRYQIVRELGRGGYGVVYQARLPGAERLYAIKHLLDPSPVHARRFEREAQVLRRLRHPNLPVITDFGFFQNLPFMAMEFIDGPDLWEVVAKEGALDPDRAAQITQTVARTMHYCHAEGVVHRDLKPANILLESSTGRVVLIDFGLLKQDAQALGALPDHERHSVLTRTGETLGTPAYMAPEQIDASFGDVGPRSDVYGLGATLYALLTGRMPFSGATSYNTILKVMQSPPPDPRSVRPGVPSSLATLCMQAMAKTPSERPASAEAFAQSLVPSEIPAKRRWPGALAVGLAIAAAAVAGWLSATPRGGAAEPPEPPVEPSKVSASPAVGPRDPTRPWRSQRSVSPPTRGALRQLAYSPTLGATLFYGSHPDQCVWAWKAGAWKPLASPNQPPPPRKSHALVWDERRDALVLFGGTNTGGLQGDLWTWTPQDGWSEASVGGPRPSARTHHAMAYDPVRELTLLVGGQRSNTDKLNDVWAWNGTHWTELTPQEGPSPALRSLHALAVDRERGSVYLFGGADPTKTRLADLWEWDGERWIEHPVSGSWPQARAVALLAHDGHGLVLHGGTSKQGVLTDTWVWTAESGWSEQRPLTIPSPRAWGGMTWDTKRKTCVSFGIDTQSGLNTWEYTPLGPEPEFARPPGWRRKAPLNAPPARDGHESATVYDGERVLVFGGWNPTGTASGTPQYFNDLWAWDGGSWTAVETNADPCPFPRYGHAAVWDPHRSQLLVVGGVPRTGPPVAWRLKDAQWSVVAAERKLVQRTHASTAYDPEAHTAYLFGGQRGPGDPLDDLWAWSGERWTQVEGAGPAARANAAFGWDPARKVLVVFGGDLRGKADRDVWERAPGASWKRIPYRPGRPSPQCDRSLAFVGDGDRLYLVGGLARTQVWIWKDHQWELDPRPRPPHREYGGFALDRKRKVLVLFGGRTSEEARLADTWECPLLSR